MDKKSNNSLTNMPIWKALLVLSAPIILTNLLQTAYYLTDAYWVWRLWPEAVATVTLSWMVVFLSISLWSWLSIAWSILIAQYFWAKNFKKVNHIASQTLLMIMIVSIVLWLIWYIFAYQIIWLFWVEESILKQTVSFIRINFIGLVFSFSFFMFQSIMRGIGKPNVPIFIMVISLVLNFLLNPYFIWSLNMWVMWAAITTLISQAVATTIWFLILFSWKYWIKLSLKDFIPDKNTIKRSFLLWYPSSIEMVARSASMVLLTWIVASFWTIALAWYGSAWNIFWFVIIFAMWLSMANSILVWQSVWAWLIDRAKSINKISAFISFILMSILWVISFVFAPNLIWFFVPWETETIKIWSEVLKIGSLFFWLIWLQMSFSWVLRAIWKTKIPMYNTILSQWILKLPIAYYLSKYTYLHLKWIWWAEPITSIILSIILFYIIIKIDWSNSNMTKDEKLEKEIIEEILIEEPSKA